MPRQCTEEDRDNIEAILRKDEIYGMAASDYFRCRQQGESAFYYEESLGYFFYPGDGRLVPFLFGPVPKIFNFTILTQTRGIFGKKEWVETVRPLINRAIFYQEEYELLCLPKDNPPTIDSQEVIQIQQEDIKRLFPLQWAYEKEEVQIPGARYTKKESLLQFKKKFSHQTNVAIQNQQDRFLAKGATNAKGFLYNQLGGIYTVPKFRRQGLGKKIISKLICISRLENKAVCLFAKKKNAPALNLYYQLGFEKKGDFCITYFR